MPADNSSSSDWGLHARMYAFIGNSLLIPMNGEFSQGLQKDFWGSFATDGDNEHIRTGIAKLSAYAERASEMELEDAVERVNVEFAHLFIGPPAPAVPVWESVAHGAKVGFGTPAFEMQTLFDKAHLEVNGPCNQYADHMGLELLYLSFCCSQFKEDEPSFEDECMLRDYIVDHPLSWAQIFAERIAEEAPGGYFEGLSELMWGLLLAEV